MITLLHEIILGGNRQARKMKAKVVNGNNASAAAASNNEAAAHLELTKSFIEKGGFKFLSAMFTRQSTGGLEKSTLKNKALTLLIELESQFMSTRNHAVVKPLLTE